MCADRVKDIQTSEEGGGKTVDKRSVGLKTLGRFFLFSSFEILQRNISCLLYGSAEFIWFVFFIFILWNITQTTGPVPSYNVLAVLFVFFCFRLLKCKGRWTRCLLQGIGRVYCFVVVFVFFVFVFLCWPVNKPFIKKTLGSQSAPPIIKHTQYTFIF